MRLTRASCLAAAVVLAGACAHNDVVEVISRDGSNSIAAINLAPAAAALVKAPSGTRAVNRFISSGAFDTSVTDAFARSSSTPVGKYFIADPNGFGYGTTKIIFDAPGMVDRRKDHYLPALVTDSAYDTTFYGSAQNVGYIVQGAHPFNGNLFWEIWHDFRHLVRSQRFVLGLARYAVEQRGALDITELQLTGAVAQPDSLVFKGGDFNPAGYKGPTQYGADCPDTTTGASTYNAVAGANPHLVGSDVSTAGLGSIELDVTICEGTVWANTFGAAKSPVPANNFTPLGSNQYNFLVLWQALADSTPDYTKPVLRVQIGPLFTTGGQVINNAFAPLPTAALTSLQLGGLPGATSRPDTMRLTFNTLKPLTTGAYQVWLLRTDSSKSQLVTGRVVRLHGTTVVDTLNNVSEFNTSSVINGARVEFDLANFPQGFWNAATLAVAGTTGNVTLPASQPLWTTSVAKPSGQTAQLTGALAFGSFHSGSSPLLFGAAGSGTGGVFGNELREDITRLARPPVGYMYEAWLTNSGDTTKIVNLGPILKPYPDLTSFIGADTAQTGAASGVEITQAAIRYVANSAAFYCNYDLVQVRLAPKNGNASLLTPTLVLSAATTKKGLGVSGCP